MGNRATLQQLESGNSETGKIEQHGLAPYHSYLFCHFVVHLCRTVFHFCQMGLQSENYMALRNLLSIRTGSHTLRINCSRLYENLLVLGQNFDSSVDLSQSEVGDHWAGKY